MRVVAVLGSLTLSLATGLTIGALAGCASQQKQTPPVQSQRGPDPAPVPPAQPPPDPLHEMTIKGELGTEDPAVIESTFQTKSAEINDCYQKGAAEHPWLGGVLELKLRVKTDGSLLFVSVQKPLGNFAVEQCVLGAAKAITFPPPKGNAEAEFTYSFTFRGRATLTEWDQSKVGEVFAEHRKKLDHCTRKGIEGGVPKSLRVALFVTPGGTAPSVGVGADRAIDPRWAECVVSEVGKWKFEDPRGKVAHVVYQF